MSIEVKVIFPIIMLFLFSINPIYFNSKNGICNLFLLLLISCDLGRRVYTHEDIVTIAHD